MLNVAYIVRRKPGEIACGDAVVIRQESPVEMLAVIDALGHGVHAARVAAMAEIFLSGIDLTLGAVAVLEGLHLHLRNTRGAAASVALFTEGAIEFCGVGNVEARCWGSRPPLMVIPGVLGHRVGTIRSFQGELNGGDRLVMFSDGLRARFDLRFHQDLDPDALCKKLLSEFGREHDDAAVVVADVRN